MARWSKCVATRRSITTARSIPPPICLMRCVRAITGASEEPLKSSPRETRTLCMTIKIEQKIVKYQLQKPEDKAADKAAEARAAAQADPDTVRDKNGRTAKVIRMHERLERAEMLIRSTPNIKN